MLYEYILFLIFEINTKWVSTSKIWSTQNLKITSNHPDQVRAVSWPTPLLISTCANKMKISLLRNSTCLQWPQHAILNSNCWWSKVRRQKTVWWAARRLRPKWKLKNLRRARKLFSWIGFMRTSQTLSPQPALENQAKAKKGSPLKSAGTGWSKSKTCCRNRFKVTL